MSILFQELFVIVVSCHLWGHQWTSRSCMLARFGNTCDGDAQEIHSEDQGYRDSLPFQKTGILEHSTCLLFY